MIIPCQYPAQKPAGFASFSLYFEPGPANANLFAIVNLLKSVFLLSAYPKILFCARSAPEGAGQRGVFSFSGAARKRKNTIIFKGGFAAH